jgi:hypothetical protein
MRADTGARAVPAGAARLSLAVPVGRATPRMGQFRVAVDAGGARKG